LKTLSRVPLFPRSFGSVQTRADDVFVATRWQQRVGAGPWYIADVRASDTTPASHSAQMEVYRRIGPEGRARLAARLSADTRELARAGIRSRHPAYTDEEVDFALRRVLYGDDLVGRAWPGRSLIEP
jgi:hypothetical protein